MRLIDADALVNVVETARKKARTLTGMDFVMVTKTQPTIDAIPVEWLKEHDGVDIRDSDGNIFARRRMTVVEALSMWQKEQEVKQ